MDQSPNVSVIIQSSISVTGDSQTGRISLRKLHEFCAIDASNFSLDRCADAVVHSCCVIESNARN